MDGANSLEIMVMRGLGEECETADRCLPGVLYLDTKGEDWGRGFAPTRTLGEPVGGEQVQHFIIQQTYSGHPPHNPPFCSQFTRDLAF